jgi:superfamily II DNA/RNA helicase
MDLEARTRAQQVFSKDVRVLISTDAGGEGLNLQFCHVIVNFDMPWNPMRIEQRIGRVDRIGQKHVVRAINFVLEDTVEHRVRQVLEAKLEVIAQEFGVDKAADVMDSVEADPIFDELFVHGLQNPDAIEQECDAVVSQLRSTWRSRRRTAICSPQSTIWTPTMPASGATTRRSSGWSAPSPAGWLRAVARHQGWQGVAGEVGGRQRVGAGLF